MSDTTQAIEAAPAATEAQETPASNPATQEGAPATTPEATQEKPKPVDKFGPQFAALARKEKAAREQAKALEERAKRLEQLEGLEKVAKENPLAALERLGLSYEQITELILTQGEPPKAEDKIAALEKRFAEKEAAEKAAREAAKAAEEAATIQGFKAHITATLTGKDEYELINALHQHEEVFNLIESYHATHGSLLSIEEAAKYVEQHLEEDTRKRLGLKKFASAPATTAQTTPSNADRETSGTVTTLTNRGTSDAAPLSADELPLDPDERSAAIRQRHRLWE